MPRIAQDFIDQLLSRIDIVDVIDQYVPLKKAGQSYMACCPFHKEKTPSFTVSPSKQFYHCFGCGAHGSAIGFLMEHQGLGFVEAVKCLADSLHLSIPEVQVEVSSEKTREQTLSLEKAVQAAAEYYKQCLKTCDEAIDYCRRRGLTGQIAARFGMGYAPSDRNGLKQIFTDYTDNTLEEAGLVIYNNEKSLRYDRFRDRLMFPIRNTRGAVIGFGGRLIRKGEPKYLNSPETVLFEKGRELYGLYEARQAIREKNRIVVVEGYMDVVALAQFGLNYAVATLGTSVTGEQVKKMLRHADAVYFCFDGDVAGRKAAWRAVENSLPFLTDGKALYFVFLPEQHDPDSYIREQGINAFETFLDENSLPLSVYFARHLGQQTDLNTVEGKADLMQRALPLLRQINAPTMGLLLKKKMAELTGVDLYDIESMLGSSGAQRTASAYRRYRLPARSHSPHYTSLINRLIKWLLMNPEWANEVDLPDGLVLEGDVAALDALAECIKSYALVPSTAQLMERLQGTAYGEKLNQIWHRSLQDPSEFMAPNDEDRRLFQDGQVKLRQQLMEIQLEDLKQKSQQQALTSSEKKLLAKLVMDLSSSSLP